MSEKIESVVLYPMRGHSRSDWYATLDDVAPSEDDAEYWALFGTTRKGHTHYWTSRFPKTHPTNRIGRKLF